MATHGNACRIGRVGCEERQGFTRCGARNNTASFSIRFTLDVDLVATEAMRSGAEVETA